MLTYLRRFLVFMAFAFWQGGFLFYASVVVPIGQEVLPSRSDQGFITRHVTDAMNVSGLVALVPLAWDVAAGADPSTARRRLRWLSWLVMLVSLGLLFWLHLQLDEHMDPAEFLVRGRSLFRTKHRWYLWVSTVQWAFGIVYALLMLKSWQEEDRKRGTSETPAST